MVHEFCNFELWDYRNLNCGININNPTDYIFVNLTTENGKIAIALTGCKLTERWQFAQLEKEFAFCQDAMNYFNQILNSK